MKRVNFRFPTIHPSARRTFDWPFRVCWYKVVANLPLELVAASAIFWNASKYAAIACMAVLEEIKSIQYMSTYFILCCGHWLESYSYNEWLCNSTRMTCSWEMTPNLITEPQPLLSSQDGAHRRNSSALHRRLNSPTSRNLYTLQQPPYCSKWLSAAVDMIVQDVQYVSKILPSLILAFEYIDPFIACGYD